MSLFSCVGSLKKKPYSLLKTQVCWRVYWLLVTFHTLTVPSLPLVAKRPFLLHQPHVMTWSNKRRIILTTNQKWCKQPHCIIQRKTKLPTLLWWASSLIKEHFRRSPAMSAKVCGRFWLLSRSWAARVRTNCWAPHWRCCEESREDRQQAARALASSRGPTAEGLWEGWAYKCAIRPARHGTQSDKNARWVKEGATMKRHKKHKKCEYTEETGTSRWVMSLLHELNEYVYDWYQHQEEHFRISRRT